MLFTSFGQAVVCIARCVLFPAACNRQTLIATVTQDTAAAVPYCLHHAIAQDHVKPEHSHPGRLREWMNGPLR